MPALVILPGWSSDLSRWQPLLGLLNQSKIPVQLIKVPYGRVRDTADYSRWLKERTKNLKSFYLLGHSFGGQIAINFTAANPSKVIKLILVDSAGIRKKLNLKRWLIAPLAKAGKGLVPERFKGVFYHLLRATDYYHATPVRKQILRRVISEDQQENLAKISCSTLIIWGRDDALTPLADGRLMHRLIKNSQLTVLPGRHGLPFTHPEVLARLVLNFIQP